LLDFPFRFDFSAARYRSNKSYISILVRPILVNFESSSLSTANSRADIILATDVSYFSAYYSIIFYKSSSLSLYPPNLAPKVALAKANNSSISSSSIPNYFKASSSNE